MFIRICAPQMMRRIEAVATPLSASRTAGRRQARAAGRALAVILVSLIAACASAGTIPSLFDAQARIARYISSGQYNKEFAAVAGRAQAYLERRAGAVSKPAIVLDIDETSLSNWPAYRMNGRARIAAGPCDLDRGPCGIRAWQAMAMSKALAPTLALARRAEALGVAVIFITGRPPELREATERNLREEGYRPSAVVLLPEGKTFGSAADFKAPERRKLAEQGFTIILNMGDQESDLRGGYAEKTFKLPNPVYFLP